MFKSKQFPFLFEYLVTYFLGLFVLPLRQFLMSPFCIHFFLCFPFSFLHLLLPCFWPFNLLPTPLFLPLLHTVPPFLALRPLEQATRQTNRRMAIRILTLCFFQVIELVILPQLIVKKKRVSHRFSSEYCRMIVLHFDWPRRIVFSKHSFHLIWRYWNLTVLDPTSTAYFSVYICISFC